MDLQEIAVGMARVKNTIAIMRADDINTKRQAVACYDFLTDLEAKLIQTAAGFLGRQLES